MTAAAVLRVRKCNFYMSINQVLILTDQITPPLPPSLPFSSLSGVLKLQKQRRKRIYSKLLPVGSLLSPRVRLIIMTYSG